MRRSSLWSCCCHVRYSSGRAVAQTQVIPSKPFGLDPQGAVVEQLSGGPVDRAVAEASGRQRSETLLRDLSKRRYAKDDQRIQALLIDPPT